MVEFASNLLPFSLKLSECASNDFFYASRGGLPKVLTQQKFKRPRAACTLDTLAKVWYLYLYVVGVRARTHALAFVRIRLEQHHPCAQK